MSIHYNAFIGDMRPHVRKKKTNVFTQIVDFSKARMQIGGLLNL